MTFRDRRSTNRKSLRSIRLLFEQLEDRVLPSVMHPTYEVYDPRGFGPATSPSPYGLTPATMLAAYGVAGTGAGQTIAIVDAYNQPNVIGDLAGFDQEFGLAAPPSFTIVNQRGGTSLPQNAPSNSWGVEISLDVEWAHVIAPSASILLVEADSESNSDLFAAIDTARNYAGVSVVSMSFGDDETSYDAGYDSHFTTPAGHTGVTFVASSGDFGAYSTDESTTMIVQYPAASPDVVSVGGTTLTTGSNGSYVSESGWGAGASSNTQYGSGGGISLFETQPTYQSGVVTQSTTNRTVPDVSMDADPNTGVAVYDSYDYGAGTPWEQIGGTSVAAPMWSGVIAFANQDRAANGLPTLDGPTQTLPLLYSLPNSDFHDITTGNNGYAAGPGYDLVTGRGSPIVNLVDNALGTLNVPTVGSFTVSPNSLLPGGSLTLTAGNVTEAAGGTISNVNFYLESNGASGLQIGADTFLGTGAETGSTWTLNVPTAGLPGGIYTVYAVATDSSGVTGVPLSGSFTIDTLVPTVSITGPANGSITKNNQPTFTASASEPGGSGVASVQFQFSANGGADWINAGPAETAAPFSYTLPYAMDDGTYAVQAIATDNAGNFAFSSTTTPISFTVDTTPPIVSLTAPANNSFTNNNQPTLTATASDNPGGSGLAIVQFQFADGQGNNWANAGAPESNGPFTYTFPAPLADGAYEVHAIAVDNAGNGTVSAVVSFSIDTTPPIVSITTEPPASSYSTSASFSFSGSDPITGGVASGVNYFQYQVDNGGYQTATSPVNLTGLTLGSHTFQVEAVDNAGNVSAPASYTWTIYSQPPPALAGLPVVNGSSAAINIVSASGDGATATITTDGTPHGFWVGELVTLTGATPGGPGGLAGTVTVTAVPSATTFQFASTYSGSETLSGATVTAALAGAQRSMVDSIVYNFSEPVNLTAAAFAISVVVDNSSTGNKVGVAPTLNVAAVPFTNEWVVTFTDPVNGSVIGNSIANGAYSITINPALATAVSDGQSLSAGETDTFYRLYGDVTGAQSVKNVDANAFNRTWGNAYYSAKYNAALDYNDDGKYTNIDANAFNRAFNTRFQVATTI